MTSCCDIVNGNTFILPKDYPCTGPAPDGYSARSLLANPKFKIKDLQSNISTLKSSDALIKGLTDPTSASYAIEMQTYQNMYNTTLYKIREILGFTISDKDILNCENAVPSNVSSNKQFNYYYIFIVIILVIVVAYYIKKRTMNTIS